VSRISFVIPVYREAGSIPCLVKAIAAEMAATGDAYDILFVDDGSPDDTWEVLQGQPCRAIRLSRNFGKEAAMAAGLEHADGDAVITMDADLQHPPSLIPTMIALWKSGKADIVEAVKETRGRECLFYRLAARTFYGLLHCLCRLDLRNASDFRLLDAKAVAAWRSLREVNLFFRGMSSWVGFQRVQVPFQVQPRQVGTSRWSLLSLVKLAVVGITSFTAVPLHFVTAMGGAFLVFAVVLGIRALIVKWQGMALDGITLLIMLLLFLGSLILIGMGIIGEYVARIYIEVKGRPRYVVGETRGFTRHAAAGPPTASPEPGNQCDP